MIRYTRNNFMSLPERDYSRSRLVQILNDEQHTPEQRVILAEAYIKPYFYKVGGDVYVWCPSHNSFELKTYRVIADAYCKKCDKIMYYNQDQQNQIQAHNMKVEQIKLQNVQARQVVAETIANTGANARVAIQDQKIPVMKKMKQTCWDASSYFHECLTDNYDFIMDPFKPRISEDKINLATHYNVNVDGTDLNDSNIEKAFINHIETVICSGNTVMRDYVLNWFAFTVMGQKLDTMLFLRGGMGTGKSLITSFLQDKIMNNNCFITQDPTPVITKFNATLEGRLLLVLEEVPICKRDWHLFETSLRQLITGNTIKIEHKGRDGVPKPNKMNIIINSNDNVLKLRNDDRRICMPDIGQRQSDSYYQNLTHQISQEHAGQVMFNYFKRRYEENQEFKNSHRIIPTSENRQELKREALGSIHRWLRDEVILKHLTIRDIISKIHDLYKHDCERQRIEAHKKIDLKRLLVDLGSQEICTTIKSVKGRYLELDHSSLFAKFREKGWLDSIEIEEYETFQQSEPSEHDFTDLPTESVFL